MRSPVGYRRSQADRGSCTACACLPLFSDRYNQIFAEPKPSLYESLICQHSTCSISFRGSRFLAHACPLAYIERKSDSIWKAARVCLSQHVTVSCLNEWEPSPHDWSRPQTRLRSCMVALRRTDHRNCCQRHGNRMQHAPAQLDANQTKEYISLRSAS